jgi:hypothetical protein
MMEENSNGDDYVDWIKWSSDAEENRLSVNRHAIYLGKCRCSGTSPIVTL